jgi:hypothetical protein
MDDCYAHVPYPHCTLLCMLKLQLVYQSHWQEPLAKIVQQSYCVALGYESILKFLVVPDATSL